LIPLLYPQHYLSWKSGWSVGRRLLDRRRYLSADHILAISQATAASLERVLAIDRSHITVVHLGIDASAFHPDGAEPEPPPRPYFLYVGDGDWRKNGAGMLSALALARREVECELVWAGRLREKYRDALKKQERALGMDGALRLLGYVDDAALGAYYRGAMATLFVSYEEGFGYPVLEAMASGCPVITSNVSCLPEVAGDAALLVSPSEPRAIADAMLALLRDAGARDDLRRRGLAHAQRFSSRAMATKTLDVYRKLVA
jgi:glycosyltransferase involved in cell wall biosynthesis